MIGAFKRLPLMSTVVSPDNVYMEFKGPVPGILGATSGFHVVFWVQSAGGAGFTRPSQEERDYYLEMGKPAPEWQCEYFDFDGLNWAEATLIVEFWRSRTKLRSLALPGRKGRLDTELCAELPELERFICTHNLPALKLNPSFQEALLRAAAEAGVIERGVAAAAPRASSGSQVLLMEDPWWRRALRLAWPLRRAA